VALIVQKRSLLNLSSRKDTCTSQKSPYIVRLTLNGSGPFFPDSESLVFDRNNTVIIRAYDPTTGSKRA